ncbi:hypothetical protein C8J57DRAFT_1295520 [Mycena rebaudengoi]|nr:hypothetical protein C8J57DRAFT_1295520 [Mycena rebaudengoi]
MKLNLRRRGVMRGAKCQDAIWTSLTALKASSDAFPPLKSVVGAVIAIWEISQRIQYIKSEAFQLALRSVEILEILADAIPDPTIIPAPMLASIARFEEVLKDIIAVMSHFMHRSRIWRFIHLNRTEVTLSQFHWHLDNACRDFTLSSAVRVEANVYNLQSQIAKGDAQSSEQQNKQFIFFRGVFLIQTAIFLIFPRLAV